MIKYFRIFLYFVFFSNFVFSKWTSIDFPYDPIQTPIISITKGINGTLIVAKGDNVFIGQSISGKWVWQKSSSNLANCRVLLTTSKGTIFLACLNGIYSSTNNGLNWISEYSSPDEEIYSLTATSDGSKVFAGTESSILYRSNLTNTWKVFKFLKEKIFIRSLVLSKDNKTLYAGTGEGIFKCNLENNMWSKVVANGLDDTDITSVLVTSDETLYAAGYCDGNLYKLIKNDNKWTKISTSLPPTKVLSLISIDNSILIVSLMHEYDMYGNVKHKGGVFQTTDKGVTWIDITTGIEPDDQIWAFHIDHENNVLYGGSQEGKLYEYKITSANNCLAEKLNSIKCTQTDEDPQDFMGLCPTEAIIGNGRLTVGISKTGKMISLFYPSPGHYNHIPYQTKRCFENPSISDLTLLGAPEYLGSFGGINIDNKGYTWLSNGIWDVKIQYAYYDVPVLSIEYTNHIGDTVVETIFVPEDLDVVVRKFKYFGKGKNIKFTYYGCFHPNSYNMYPPLYNADGSEHIIKLGYPLGWNFNASTTKAEVGFDKKAIIFSQWELLTTKYTISCAGEINSKFANPLLLGVNGLTVIGGNWLLEPVSIYNSGSNYPDKSKFQESTGLIPQPSQATAGALIWDISESKEITIYISVGENLQKCKNNLEMAVYLGFYNLLTRTINNWRSMNYNRKIDNLPLQDQEIKNYLKLWATIMRLMYYNSNEEFGGGIIASPNFQPKYYTMWPRDAMFQLLVWELLDEHEIVKKTIKKLFSLLEEDKNGNKYWAQTYSLDGSYQGFPIYNLDLKNYYDLHLIEEDQMPELLWFIWLCYTRNKGKDDNFKNFSSFCTNYLGISVTDVRKLADYVLSRIVQEQTFFKGGGD